MNAHLNWKKGIFSNTCNIYSDSAIEGKLKNKTFSNQTEADMNGEEYLFFKKSAFKSETQIIDRQKNIQIGTITYNTWNTKATISIGDKIVNWKYNNTWQTKWSIFNSEGEQINYKGHENKGGIESQIDDNLLLLTGLFVTNYISRSSSVAFFIIFSVMIFTHIIY